MRIIFCNFTTNFLHLNTNSLSVLYGDMNLFCVFISQYRCLKQICVVENGQVCMKKLALLCVNLQSLSGYVCNTVDRSIRVGDPLLPTPACNCAKLTNTTSTLLLSQKQTSPIHGIF